MTMPVQYGQVKWRAVSAAADTTDADALPDARPVTGAVTFTAEVTDPLLSPQGADPVTIFPLPVSATIDAGGVLRDADGRPTVTLVATDSAGVTPTGWTWRATYALNGGVSRGAFSFKLPAGTTVDLTSVAPVATTGGTPIIQGPAGDGLPTVIHGADATVARPVTARPVLWFGSVAPNNLADGDVYVPVAAS